MKRNPISAKAVAVISVGLICLVLAVTPLGAKAVDGATFLSSKAEPGLIKAEFVQLCQNLGRERRLPAANSCPMVNGMYSPNGWGGTTLRLY